MASKLTNFHDAVQSLKLYRRAELPGQDNNSAIVEKLYVDPLPNDHVFETVRMPNTSFIIGRKGTGKSTIFQRLQYELTKDKKKTSAYVDIKTIFESSQVDSRTHAKIATMDFALPPQEIERILLLKSFIISVIVEIKKELKKRTESSFWETIKDSFSGSLDELFEELDELIEEIDVERFISVLGIKHVQGKQQEENIRSSGENAEIKLKIDPNPVDFTVGGQRASSTKDASEISYSDILISVFDIKDLLSKLKTILSNLGVRHLYILVDDFSELPEDAMKVVVDLLLAPLNNWSEEFIKLKVAAYPGRIYYGQIDKTKIDEVYLDIYKLYGSNDVSTMEDNATEFVRRLVMMRIKVYKAGKVADYFDSNLDEILKELFYATMGNPRIIGYLLHYCHESHLIYDRKIGVRAIQQAAKKYYEDKIESYFSLSKFLHESFGEKSSIFGLKELLEMLVVRAKELRSHSSSVFDSINGRPPTSHFHVSVAYESILQTLELNFFLTKYYEMSDRDGRKVSVYAMNYGLCQKYTLAFGRPGRERAYRLYFVERVFDYSPLLHKYMAKNQEIICQECEFKYSIDDLEAIRWNKMKCRECASGICEVVNLSKKYENVLRDVDKSLLLPAAELGILQTLHLGTDAMFAGDIASELDCSYQLIGRRGRYLHDKGLVVRGKNDAGRRVFAITDLAEESYFSQGSDDDLSVETADDMD
ncbi:helix-turn-helix domain-containing protein [Pseudomonas lutea]|uniref:helix-turn-helix domain-containing protein n=1 Tax=Pseudomonas lutea TaxID=243924 RepID=UPI00056037DA|nr:helix-turn-helix domain-containing protein [Pseudomonas lutea]